MRFRSFSAAVFVLLLLGSAARADGPTEQPVGTVVLVEGFAYAQKGDIHYTRPRVGAEVRVSARGEYHDTPPLVPAFVKWAQNTRRRLKPNDSIYAGELIQTSGDGWVKILYKDDSLMDVGPAALLEVSQFEGEGESRRVAFKMLYGKIRTLVTRRLAGPDHYRLSTPNLDLGVRGTEFLVNAFPGKDGAIQSEIVCLHGQVSVDVPKHSDKGLVYHQPVVVHSGMTFLSQGVHGLGQRTVTRSVSQEELRALVARLSPLVNVHGTFVGSTPGPNQMIGTGVGLKSRHAAVVAQRQPQKTPSSFDLDRPASQRTIASPSGNFWIPDRFGIDPAAFGQLRDDSRLTGPSPIDQLPAYGARVTVRLNGL